MSYLKTWFLITVLSLSVNVAAQTSLQEIKNLREFKQQVKKSGLPVLLLFTAEDCDYCDFIRNNYLFPMIESGEYQSKILFRQLYIDDFNYLRNIQGKLIAGDQIALKYDVEVTPTILFIDVDWKELADRIIGINNPDYFDKLLNDSILQSHLMASQKKQN